MTVQTITFANLTDVPTPGAKNLFDLGCHDGSTTGLATASAASKNVTLAASGSFANGQNVLIVGAGAACTLAAPTGLMVTTGGATGSTHRAYQVAGIDANGGVGPACAAITVTNGNATLQNGETAVAQYQILAWDALANAVSYVVYLAGAFIAVTEQLAYNHYGDTQVAPSWIASAPLATAQAGFFTGASIVSGGGTTALVLDTAIPTAVSGAVIVIDSTVALQGALALGVPLIVPEGTFVTRAGLSHANGQVIFGVGAYQAIIQGWGHFNILTGTSTQGGGITDVGFDLTNMVGGYVVYLNGGNNFYGYNLQLTNAYNMLQIGNASSYTNWRYIQCSGHLRGDIGTYIWGTDASGVTSVHNLERFIDAGSNQAVGVLVDGRVATINFNLYGVQNKPNQFVFQNTLGASEPPLQMRLNRCGVNLCWGIGVNVLAGKDIQITQMIAQGATSMPGPLLFFASGVTRVKLVQNELFGATTYGVSSDAGGVTMSGNLIYNNNTGSVFIGPDSYDIDVIGGSNSDMITGSQATEQTYGVTISSGAKNVNLNCPNYRGTTVDINDLGGVNVTIAGRLQGSPPGDAVAGTGAQTLSASTYTHLYTAIAGRLATLDASGLTAAANYTTDTATNILAAIPGVVIVGTIFKFRIINHSNHVITLHGGTGVTPAGTQTVAANGLAGTEAYQDFIGQVTGVGGSAALTITGI